MPLAATTPAEAMSRPSTWWCEGRAHPRERWLLAVFFFRGGVRRPYLAETLLPARMDRDRTHRFLNGRQR